MAEQPTLFSTPPLLRDALITESSKIQDQTVRDCLPFLKGDVIADPEQIGRKGLPKLLREAHVEYLVDSLSADFPVPYDAVRPWLVYWALAGLTTLGEDVTSYRDRVVQNFTAAQNPDGGFGGGHGQYSHCAPSYAAVLSLAMVGGTALDTVDRRALWKWLGSIKQSDGGFEIAKGAEEDVRASYCSMVMIALLNLPLELPADSPAREAGLTLFTDRLPEWLSRCQTYEGGLSGAPGSEAHGAYAFCVTACLCILGEPKEMIAKYLDLPLLVSWLSARQYAPEGGFSGRTNKLVDGCYSHWVGGCWPFIDAALFPSEEQGERSRLAADYLYSGEGLVRYILASCQLEDGGLRDKPPMRPDSYHSCYVLAGLSSAQHRSTFKLLEEESGNPLGSAFGWTYLGKVGRVDEQEDGADEEDIVEPVHPIFVIPFAAVERTRAWFRERSGF